MDVLIVFGKIHLGTTKISGYTIKFFNEFVFKVIKLIVRKNSNLVSLLIYYAKIIPYIKISEKTMF